MPILSHHLCTTNQKTGINKTEWRGTLLIWLVGVTGVEPATPASRRQCSTRLSYTPTESNPAQINPKFADIGRQEERLTENSASL